MKVYNKKGYIVMGKSPYVAKLMTYQMTELVVRLIYVGRKIIAIKHDELEDEDGNKVTDIERYMKSLKIAEDDTPKTAIEIESELYSKRVADGLQMSIDLMAELRVNSKTKELPRIVNQSIEKALEKVKLNIDRGWWITALEELEKTTVSIYFNQDLYDRIHLKITTYISENY